MLLYPCRGCIQFRWRSSICRGGCGRLSNDTPTCKRSWKMSVWRRWTKRQSLPQSKCPRRSKPPFGNWLGSNLPMEEKRPGEHSREFKGLPFLDINSSTMDPPIYYSRSEYIETVSCCCCRLHSHVYSPWHLWYLRTLETKSRAELPSQVRKTSSWAVRPSFPVVL